MDPNANLDEQLALAKELLDPASWAFNVEEKAVRLAELVEGLDHWLTGGGFLPTRWAEQQKGKG
jgi:hypothetical protein